LRESSEVKPFAKDGIATSAIGRARYEGYRKALRAHGQKVDPVLVWDISQGYRADAGHQAMSEALAKGPYGEALVLVGSTNLLEQLHLRGSHGILPDAR